MNVGGDSSARAAQVARIICIAAWCAAFIATHVPASRLPALPASDKLLHSAAYFALACVLLVTLSLRGMRRRRRMLTVISVAILYGAFDEITQPLVSRYASWGDWLADVLGALAAIAIFEAISALRKMAQERFGR